MVKAYTLRHKPRVLSTSGRSYFLRRPCVRPVGPHRHPPYRRSVNSPMLPYRLRIRYPPTRGKVGMLAAGFV